MAVKYDTPWGPIEADNAASEATLQAILAALDKDSIKNKKTQKADEDAAKASSERTKADKDATKAGKDFSVGWAAAGDAAVKGLKDIGLTAVSMATKFGTDFANIAENPIKETANMLNSLIDVGANVVSSFAEAIPVIGGFIAAATKAAAELAKAANKAFAEQLQKNIDTLQAYNKVGVSFSGSMTQMANVAHGAGLGIVDFSKIVSANKDELNKLGMAGGEAATKLGTAMGAATKTIGRSGLTLRDEMFKMGYAYEEQGAIFASFMANQQVSGKLRSMTDKEIAEGTRQYAKDLKVIADITGQDAKKLVEKGRAEAQRGALLNKLQGDQRDAFIESNAVLAKAGPDAQQAVLEMLTFGKVRDPKLAAQQELVKMATDVAAEVQSGNKDIVNATTQSLVQLNKDLTTGQGAKFGEAVDRALVARVTGIGSEIAQSRNQLMANLIGMFDPEAAGKSGKAAEDMATKQDQLADETAQLYAQTKEYQVLMEKTVNPELGRYAELLKDTNELLSGNFMKFIKKISEMSEQDKTEEDISKNLEGFWEHSEHYFLKSLEGVVGLFGENNWYQQNMIKSRQEAEIEYLKKQGRWTGEHDSGGTIGAGQYGIAGERGPELISGPASVLSTSSTESLTKTLDAMNKMTGKQFSETNSTLKDRIKGFDKVDYKQLNFDNQRKQEMLAASTPERLQNTDSGMSQLESTLNELVRLMRQNVDQTTRVAMNTN